jgi:8-oxo-dGTP diphosphatase
MIEAAGGILWRRRPGTSLEVALVNRRRYGGDWTLPKGKLRPGEQPLQAALREVREETGYEANALGFLGAIAYDTPSGPKRVRFWNMVAERHVRAAVDISEVAETVWLSPNDAIARMNYPLERALLEAYMGDQLAQDTKQNKADRLNVLRKLWLWLTLKDIAYENLTPQLPLVQMEFAGLCDEIEKNNKAMSGAWAPRVRALLQQAEDRKVEDPELAWRSAKAAERALLFAENTLYPGEADAKACSLLTEVDEKISNWRGKAIKKLLVPRPSESLPVWKVVKATQLADEHHDNAFRRLKILRQRLRLFVAASVVLTGLYMVLSAHISLLPSVVPAYHGVLPILTLALMGLMGEIVSVWTSVKSVSSELVPLQRAQSSVLFGRLALGPLSALAIATILATGIIKGQVPDYMTMVGVAFVSGFSERFVLNSIEAFANKV